MFKMSVTAADAKGMVEARANARRTLGEKYAKERAEEIAKQVAEVAKQGYLNATVNLNIPTDFNMSCSTYCAALWGILEENGFKPSRTDDCTQWRVYW